MFTDERAGRLEGVRQSDAGLVNHWYGLEPVPHMGRPNPTSEQAGWDGLPRKSFNSQEARQVGTLLTWHPDCVEHMKP